MPHKLTDQQKIEVVHHILAGSTRSAVARQYGVTASNVSRLVQVRLTPDRPFGRKLSDRQKIEIVQRYIAGESMNRLASAYHVTYQNISKILARRGVSRAR